MAYRDEVTALREQVACLQGELAELRGENTGRRDESTSPVRIEGITRSVHIALPPGEPEAVTDILERLRSHFGSPGKVSEAAGSTTWTTEDAREAVEASITRRGDSTSVHVRSRSVALGLRPWMLFLAIPLPFSPLIGGGIAESIAPDPTYESGMSPDAWDRYTALSDAHFDARTLALVAVIGGLFALLAVAAVVSLRRENRLAGRALAVLRDDLLAAFAPTEVATGVRVGHEEVAQQTSDDAPRARERGRALVR